MASRVLSKTVLDQGPARSSAGRDRPQGPHPSVRPYDRGGLRRLVALGLAIGIQLIAGAVLFNHVWPQPKPGDHLVELELVETPEKPPDPPPPMPTVQLPPAPHVVSPAPPALRIVAPKPVTVAATPVPSPPVSAPPPPPAPAQAPGIEDAFKAAVRAAIFAAHRVPDSARLLAQFGETRVSFILLDGRAGDVRLVAGSGHESLDRAALAAVRDARYPPVPEELRGRAIGFEITLYHRQGS